MSVTGPDLVVFVEQIPLGVSQPALRGLEALLQGLHLPLHLQFVLADGHVQLAQLEATTRPNQS